MGFCSKILESGIGRDKAAAVALSTTAPAGPAPPSPEPVALVKGC